MLTTLRTDVAAKLAAAGITAVEYIGETLTPPCAVVVPSQPYITAPSRSNLVPFGHVQVAVDVLLLVSPEAAKTAAHRIDQLTEQAYVALSDEHDVTQVTRPGLTELPKTKQKFVGCVLSIEEVLQINTTEEP